MFFLLFGRGACLLFAVWAGVVFFFAVWAGGVCVCFFVFGRGTGVYSLTGLPGSSLRDPTTKKTKQQQKEHGFPNLRGCGGS